MRKSFESTGLLPDEILWRTKEAFSDGVSKLNKSWYQIIQENVDLLCVKDINLKSFYEENIIFINSSLLISIIFLLFFNRSFMFSLTTTVSFLLITLILKNFIMKCLMYLLEYS